MRIPGKVWFTLALGALLQACAGNSVPQADAFGAYNAIGGAGRANDYSAGQAPPAASLDKITLDTASGCGLAAPPLALAYDRSAVLFNNGLLALLRYDSVVTRYRFPAGQRPMPGLAADSTGRLYAVTTAGMVYALDTAGRLAWARPVGADTMAAPAGRIVAYSLPLSTGSGVVAGSTAGDLVCYDTLGKQRWRTRSGAGYPQVIAADPQCGIVAALCSNLSSISDTLTAYDPATGSVRWALPLAGMQIVCGPIVTAGHIVAGAVKVDSDGTRQPWVVTVSSQGKVLWQKSLPVIPRGIAADKDGNLYVSGSGASSRFSGGALLSFDLRGGSRWEKYFESALPAAPAISAEWVYFVSRRNGRTGVFTYSHDGQFRSFVSVDLLPDISPQVAVLPVGQAVFSCTEQPVILRGSP